MSKHLLKDKLVEAKNYLNEVSRLYDYRDVYCVNVKRYDDFVDIEDIIAEQKYKPAIASRVREHFTDELRGMLYQDWLEYEACYFIDEYLKENCCDDKKVKKYMQYIDVDSIGLYGRSGGWFGFHADICNDIDDTLADLEDGATWAQLHESHDIPGIFATVEAIQWLLDEANAYNKGLDFKDELKFRIEEYIEEVEGEVQAQKEIKQAVTLAKKHGLIVAKAL